MYAKPNGSVRLSKHIKPTLACLTRQRALNQGGRVMKEGKGPKRRPSGSVYPHTEEPLQPARGSRVFPKVRGDTDGVSVAENLVK